MKYHLQLWKKSFGFQESVLTGKAIARSRNEKACFVKSILRRDAVA